jgi:hypothetical protein
MGSFGFSESARYGKREDAIKRVDNLIAGVKQHAVELETEAWALAHPGLENIAAQVSMSVAGYERLREHLVSGEPGGGR